MLCIAWSTPPILQQINGIHSWAVVDLITEATLTMPETGGCYQRAWIINEERYNRDGVI